VFLATVASGGGAGAGFAVIFMMLIPLWPIALPFYVYSSYQSWTSDPVAEAKEAEKQRLFVEQSVRSYDDQQRAKLNAEMHARMAAEAKAKEASEAAARETQVTQVTEAKTAATTAPEPAAVVADATAVPAK